MPTPSPQTLLSMADMVVPCNASFNTAWELWLGAREARLMPLLNALEIDHYPCLQVGAAARHVFAGLVESGVLSAPKARQVVFAVTDYTTLSHDPPYE
jgi:hypothetical protein